MKLRLRHLTYNPVFRRWVDILFLSAFVVILALVLQPDMNEVSNRWTAYTTKWPTTLRSSTTVLFAAVSSLILIRLGSLGARFRLITMLRYPPTWISSFITVITLVLLHSLCNTLSISLCIWEYFISLLPTFNIACCGVFLAFIYQSYESARSKPTKVILYKSQHTHARSLATNDEDLLAWILDETPIKLPTDDVFDHAIPARRIARLLMQKATSSIGVIGPYGCGKSSLLNLIEYYLENTSELGLCPTNPSFSGRIIRCKIDGWGRVSGTVAQKIIALAIEEVKQHVDCMSIISLPENYRKAIAGAKSAGGAILSALLQTSHDPVAQLSKLDNILAAANMRLVIFLEDLDRNIGDDIIRDEMPALLDRLRSLGQVSFVLAIGTDRQFSDVLIRICDHVEAVS